MTSLYRLAAMFAALGCVLSIWIVLGGLFGIVAPLGGYEIAVVLAVFPLLFVAMQASRQLTQDFPQKEAAKAMFRGLPDSLRRTVYVLWGLGLLAFFLLFAVEANEDGSESSFLPFGIGAFMFHLWTLAVLVSRLRVESGDLAARCPNGHPVSAAARYCERCGAAVEGSRHRAQV